MTSLNKEQLKVETFFYEEIIFSTFDSARTLIKKLGNEYSLVKVGQNGHFNICKNGEIIAEFKSSGLSFI